MSCCFLPICIECGSPDNPCGCKILGPTLAFVAFVIAAVIEWPVGAVVFCCSPETGRRIMGHPTYAVYPAVNSCIPI